MVNQHVVFAEMMLPMSGWMGVDADYQNSFVHEASIDTEIFELHISRQVGSARCGHCIHCKGGWCFHTMQDSSFREKEVRVRPHSRLRIEIGGFAFDSYLTAGFNR
jgi:hypothetical protein